MTPPSPSPAVSYAVDGDVAVIEFDDGKANVLTHEVIAALAASIERAGAEAKAIALIGREGRFCAGFDLTTMRAGPAEAWELLQAGANLALDIYLSPVPVVIGCTGHALAMGAILLMAGDSRIGAEGPFKLGMNEVAIGMPMPRFAAWIAGERLTTPHLIRSLQLAHVYDPPGALAAGYLDDLSPALLVAEKAMEHAHELAAKLDPAAFRATRTVLRGSARQAFTQAMTDDVSAASQGQV